MANEKRLIDANALRQEVESKIYWGQSDNVSVLEAIDDAPTVDAVEVVHSAWKNGNCMKCGLYVGETTSKHFHYCPNCGAKMDGDGNA